MNVDCETGIYDGFKPHKEGLAAHFTPVESDLQVKYHDLSYHELLKPREFGESSMPYRLCWGLLSVLGLPEVRVISDNVFVCSTNLPAIPAIPSDQSYALSFADDVLCRTSYSSLHTSPAHNKPVGIPGFGRWLFDNMALERTSAQKLEDVRIFFNKVVEILPRGKHDAPKKFVVCPLAATIALQIHIHYNFERPHTGNTESLETATAQLQSS
ncbi:hypothetical protein V5O48_015247 [Marasmius crinis-equi]|uniref:Uncharacterized protein n=1 Tax=Marasmius crinis-equi TaxID=585013 RepID=A0ABR3EV26_9AGAR